MIDILNTENYRINDFELLIENELKNNTFLQIAIPKSTQQFSSTSEDIAYEYLKLAALGEKLNDKALTFNYSKTTPLDGNSIVFELLPKDVKALSKTLFELSQVYGDNPDDPINEFEKLDEFRQNAERNPVACSHFYEVYLEFRSDGDYDE